MENEPDYFSAFNLIIASNLPDVVCRVLAKICWNFKIPLVIARVNGLLGSCRLVYQEHTIVESKPEGTFADLRLATPFPALIEYCDEVDMRKLDSAEHGHVPFVVILKKCADKWKAEHGGNLPDDNKREEKAAFKESIKTMINPDKEWGEELNFTEAYNQVRLNFASLSPPPLINMKYRLYSS
jgi:amyloid beta precursor protein binding protein 1